MRITFFSNFMNHHQLPFCRALMELPDVEFRFVAMQKLPKDRKKMGYEDMNEQYPFVVRAYKDRKTAKKLAQESDVVIFGDSSTSYMKYRMKNDRLSFRFTERLLRKGAWRRFQPWTAKHIYDGFTRYKNKNLYLMTIGNYAAQDLIFLGMDPAKCFQWGYFPDVHEENMDELFAQKQQNEVPEILYAGRLLALKHVPDAVRAVAELKRKGIPVHFTVIGEGKTENEIKDIIKDEQLEDYVTLHPFVPHTEVRGYMQKADIYVFCSNIEEGWGVVINEAMNSACSCVVSRDIGAAESLIRDGENGFVYSCGDIPALTQYLCMLAQDKALCQKTGRKAYETLCKEWTPCAAAERFLNLCNALLRGEDASQLYRSGPCAPVSQKEGEF